MTMSGTAATVTGWEYSTVKDWIARNGGAVMGAWDGDRMVGFVFGFLGIFAVDPHVHAWDLATAVDVDPALDPAISEHPQLRAALSPGASPIDRAPLSSLGSGAGDRASLQLAIARSLRARLPMSLVVQGVHSLQQ